MKTSYLKNALVVPAAALLSLAGLALAQDDADNAPPVARFVTLPAKPAAGSVQPNATLPTWNGSFTFNGRTFNYNMVGTAPSSNVSTTVHALIIPLKIVITNSDGTKTTFDPSTVLSNGRTVVQNVVVSPLFDSSTTYVQGGVNVGTTQYIDAYQRANFWGAVSSNPNYHLLLGGPSVVRVLTLSPPTNQGKTRSPYGFPAGEVNINWFDGKLQAIITKLGIPANTFPIFLTYDVYLTQFGCCIGGYHSAMGAQAYAHATYVDHPGIFSQDVSALSHEIGEWADDPLVVNANGNPVPCGPGSILEVGDPLENNPNFGAYPYTVNGFQYNLQDLVTLPYFGAPPGTSVNSWFTFQGETLSVCQNGG
ncbi:MAG TPA: hypothetical protein VMG35_15285 [Bryobacteraceae bacterium]|nr:hypothetical protein [Bryobacteraceae bacterium]